MKAPMHYGLVVCCLAALLVMLAFSGTDLGMYVFELSDVLWCSMRSMGRGPSNPVIHDSRRG